MFQGCALTRRLDGPPFPTQLWILLGTTGCYVWEKLANSKASASQVPCRVSAELPRADAGAMQQSVVGAFR